MKKFSFIVKFSIFLIAFVLMILVVVGLFTTGAGKNVMMTNEELSWQKTRLITLSVIAGILLIGIISFATFLIVKNKQAYEIMIAEEETNSIEE